jgi:hypothetical protein
MIEKGNKTSPDSKNEAKDSKAKTIDKKDEKLSEEDLRKISGGIEPRVYRPT